MLYINLYKKVISIPVFKQEQYVCKVCGFNIIGHFPTNCPFCGALNTNFITAAECSKKYKISKHPVSENVFRLKSEPKLGLEHNAYQLNTKNGIIWIDCPSTFDDTLEKSKINLFTHHHFIAAANLYKKFFSNELWINKNDSENHISDKYKFDNIFEGDFAINDIEAFHINGHTKGFTCYIFEHNLFICDYIFIRGENTKFNPYGPQDKTIKGARILNDLLEQKEIKNVCGVDYILEYKNWKPRFHSLIV